MTGSEDGGRDGARSGRRVADLGEAELVSRILGIVAEPGAAGVGPGDDAAVLEVGGTRIAVTVDHQVEEVHFRRSWCDPGTIGRRSVAVNVSDLGAVGAEPRWAVWALSLPGEVEEEWVEGLVCGVRDGAREFGCAVVGGDVTRTQRAVSSTVTAIGELPGERGPLRRDGARPGDGLWLTGAPGRAAAGRSLLSAGFRLGGDSGDGVLLDGSPVDDRKDADHARACLRAWCRPEPPVSLACAWAEEGLARAALDVSDGVARDLLRLCDASGVGVVLDGDSLCLDPTLRHWQERGLGRVRDWVLGGGEDYQLLCAVGRTQASRFAAAAERHDVPVRTIGQLSLPSEGYRVQLDGELRSLDPHGWDPFREVGDGA